MDKVQVGLGVLSVSGEGTLGIATAFTIVVLVLLSVWWRR